MADPRLNSLHLDADRRDHFRRARDVLLQARGTATLCAERLQETEKQANRTLIRNNGAPPPSQLHFWLVDREFIYPLKVGLNTLGRSHDNDIVVEDLFISRRHCAILVHHDLSCVLQDIASKNGTYLNGTKINGPTRLNLGDEIRICNRQFVFLCRTDRDEPRPVPDSGTRTLG